MIVVADTSPLNYLVLIGSVECLPLLYGKVYIPPACASELVAPAAPLQVRSWFENSPTWLIVAAPKDPNDPRLSHLDRGEREALALAMELHASLVLIDERDGRSAAKICGLTIAGTLRVLADAAAVGAVNLELAFIRLQSTGFRADPRLIDLLLVESRKRV